MVIFLSILNTRMQQRTINRGNFDSKKDVLRIREAGAVGPYRFTGVGASGDNVQMIVSDRSIHPELLIWPRGWGSCEVGSVLWGRMTNDHWKRRGIHRCPHHTKTTQQQSCPFCSFSRLNLSKQINLSSKLKSKTTLLATPSYSQSCCTDQASEKRPSYCFLARI